MSFLEQANPIYSTSGVRFFAGLIAAPVVPPLILGAWLFDFEGVGTIISFGFISVWLVFLPLLLWLLPRHRNSFRTCLVAGVIAAPGPFGFLLAFMALFGPYARPTDAIMILLNTMPFGAAGGILFWIVAFWRSEEQTLFDRTEEEGQST
jgi:hypothetical protein